MTDDQTKLTIMIGVEAAKKLFDAGYVVVRRPGDPYELPLSAIPKDRSYQWFHMEHDKFHFIGADGQYSLGWAPVDVRRHPGYFAPINSSGHAIVNGLGLFEKPKFEVRREQQEYIDASRRQSEQFFHGKGFSGGVTILEESGGSKQPHKGGAVRMDVDPDGPSTQSAIPVDLVYHLPKLMAERDRIYVEISGGRHMPKSEELALKDRALQAAIETVRASVRQRKEITSAQTSSNSSAVPIDPGAEASGHHGGKAGAGLGDAYRRRRGRN